MTRALGLLVLVTAVSSTATAYPEPASPNWVGGFTPYHSAIKGVKRFTIETRTPRGFYSAAFSPDSTRMATYGYDGVLRLWSIPKSQLLAATLVGMTVSEFAWSPDGATLALAILPVPRLDGADAKSHVRLLDGKTLVHQSHFDAPVVFSLCWSPDGKQIATAGGGAVTFHDLAGKDPPRAASLYPVTDSTKPLGYRLGWSPDGKWVAAVPLMGVGTLNDLGREVLLLDAAKREVTVRHRMPDESAPVMGGWGHAAPWFVREPVAWTPDSRFVGFWARDGIDKPGEPFLAMAYGGKDGKVDLARNIPGGEGGMRWDNDNTRLLTGRAVALPFKDKVAKKTGLSGDENDALVPCPNGKYIAALQPFGQHSTMGLTTKLALHDATTGKRLPGGIEGFGSEGMLFSGDHSNRFEEGLWSYYVFPWVRGSEFALPDEAWGLVAAKPTRKAPPVAELHAWWSPGGKYWARYQRGDFLVGSGKLFNAGKPLARLASEKRKFAQLTWSADEKRAATAVGDEGWSGNYVLGVWSVPDGKRLATWKTPYSQALALSPDGKKLLNVGTPPAVYTVGEDKPVPLARQPAMEGLLAAGWSPDGKQCYVCSSNRAWAFDAETGVELREDVYSGWPLCAKPGSNWAALSVHSGVRFWNMHTRRQGGTLLIPAKGVSVAISPDGHYHASVAGAERLLVYIVETDEGKMLTLTPAEFATRFGWRNNPAAVRLGLAEPKS